MLLKIVALMIENKIVLTADNYSAEPAGSRAGHPPKVGGPGIYGWLATLSADDKIAG